MKIIRGLHNLKEINSHSIVTIGNFDGVHLGHQKLLHFIKKISKKNKIPTIIILFEPQPLEFLKKKDAPIRISKFSDKIRHISLYNIDIILCIKFNTFFSNIKPKDFIINVLINKLHIKFIVVGNDFKFGHQRSGNIQLLKQLSQEYKFNIIKIPCMYKNNIKISSTNIRKELSKNNMTLSTLLLGRPFSISGRIIHGSAIGRTLGYPTANILLNNRFLLTNGVYAVKIWYNFKTLFFGICNIGIKPSFKNITKNKILEVHLFNTNINLYEKKIEILIYKKIRNEQIFLLKEELKNQIAHDIKIVKKYFHINKN